MNKKNIIILLVLILGGLFFWFSQNNSVSGKIHSIVLNADGFKPAEITIQKGDSVVFTSTKGIEFWPASDLHPSHTIYPEFDPREPVPASSPWTFKFDQVGSWRFHDHLFSSERGVVNVLDDKSNLNVNIDCASFSGKQQCWKKQIKTELGNKGLDAAFEILAHFYATEPDFASSCHSHVHILGEAAYEIFSKHENLEISSKTSYCGFGFYHGFMETLLQKTGNAEEAIKFCSYVGDKLKNQTSDAEGACYHGIGHGAVDGGDPRFWGNPKAMIKSSLEMCEKIAGSDRSLHGKLYRCITGVYNSIETLSTNPKYRIDQISKNPFYLCPTQPLEYKEGCYVNMLPALMRFTNQDFIKSTGIIEQIKEDKNSYVIRSQVILSLFHEFIRINLNKPDYNVKVGVALCRELGPFSRLPCIEGLSGGHMKYGEPTKEYVKGIAFCNSLFLVSDEKDVCFKFILSRLRIWYGGPQVPKVCESAPLAYRKYCN